MYSLLSVPWLATLRRRPFVANVLTMAAGTALAQIIPIAISPLLTRLYDASDFGTFALYMSLASITSILATGRYELAIMIPEDDRDALSLVHAGILLASGTATVILILVLIARNQIAWLFGNEQLTSWLLLLPATLLLSGIYISLYYWVNRNRKFKALTVGNITQTGTTGGANLLLAGLNWGAGGLIGGSIAGQIASAGVLVFKTNKSIPLRIYSWSLARIKLQLKRYCNFPIYSVPTDFINAAINYAPTILLSSFFGPTTAGLYALTQRVLGLPVQVISGAIRDVFREQASRNYRESGTCRPLFRKVLGYLSFFSIVPFSIVIWVAPDLFSFVFGEEWRRAGDFARVLCLMYMARFIVSPLTYVFIIAERQKEDFGWHLYMLLSMVLSIVGGYLWTKDELITLALFAANYVLIYLIYLIRSYYLAHAEPRHQGQAN